LEILEIVDIFLEDRLAVVSSLEDMVRVTDGNGTGNTRHMSPPIRSILSFRYVQSALKKSTGQTR
jgi:hypothetical protein